MGKEKDPTEDLERFASSSTCMQTSSLFSITEQSSLLNGNGNGNGNGGVHQHQHQIMDNNNNNVSYSDPLLGQTSANQQQENNNPMSKPSSSVTTRAQKAWKRLALNVDELLVFDEDNSGFGDNKRNKEESRRMLREEAVHDIRAGMEFTLWHCAMALLLYLAIAVAAFSFVFDHFTVIDAMYFAVITMTTIGYGDLVPRSGSARIFTCFFALTGVACLGIALGVIGNRIIEAQHKAMEGAREISKKRAMSLFKPSTEPETPVSNNNDKQQQQQQQHPLDESSLSHIILELATVIALLTVFAALLPDDLGTKTEGWDRLGNSLYYAIISATTIGYGDFTPKSQMGRLFAVFFIPLTVGVMGHWLSLVAGRIIDEKQSTFRRKMETKELTMQDLDVMDQDGDGEVTQMEFLEFMLVAMNKVDEETLVGLREYFARLDGDGSGTLSKEDLIALAKRKLKTPQRKLELGSYKQSLLQKAGEV